MKKFKAKVYKYGGDDFDVVVFEAHDFDSFWLEIENFCRRSATYAEWKFIGIEDDEI